MFIQFTLGPKTENIMMHTNTLQINDKIHLNDD
jgi:hypothetical protein